MAPRSLWRRAGKSPHRAARPTIARKRRSRAFRRPSRRGHRRLPSAPIYSGMRRASQHVPASPSAAAASTRAGKRRHRSEDEDAGTASPVLKKRREISDLEEIVSLVAPTPAFFEHTITVFPMFSANGGDGGDAHLHSGTGPTQPGHWMRLLTRPDTPETETPSSPVPSLLAPSRTPSSRASPIGAHSTSSGILSPVEIEVSRDSVCASPFAVGGSRSGGASDSELVNLLSSESECESDYSDSAEWVAPVQVTGQPDFSHDGYPAFPRSEAIPDLPPSWHGLDGGPSPARFFAPASVDSCDFLIRPPATGLVTAVPAPRVELPILPRIDPLGDTERMPLPPALRREGCLPAWPSAHPSSTFLSPTLRSAPLFDLEPEELLRAISPELLAGLDLLNYPEIASGEVVDLVDDLEPDVGEVVDLVDTPEASADEPVVAPGFPEAGSRGSRRIVELPELSFEEYEAMLNYPELIPRVNPRRYFRGL